MDSNTVHKLSTRVPTLTRKFDLRKFETARGASFRNYALWLTLVPMIALLDLNGGLARFGFKRTTFEQEYKVRPDYVTETLFVAHRQDVPEFRHF